jgi:hypothetical protein
MEKFTHKMERCERADRVRGGDGVLVSPPDANDRAPEVKSILVPPSLHQSSS